MTQQFATPADALAHYGVKGMRWGVTKVRSAGRAVKKAFNEAAAEEERENNAILQARINDPALRRSYKAAKVQYKTDKVNLGKTEARRILNKSGDAYYNNLVKAQQSTSQEKWQKMSRDMEKRAQERRVEQARRDGEFAERQRQMNSRR